MVTFRPLPVLSLCSAIVLLILIWLGIWQIQRSQWKAEAIEDWTAQQANPPLSLDEAICRSEPLINRRLELDRVETSAGSVKVYGRHQNGIMGWRIFRPLSLPQCADTAFSLIETGFETLNGDQIEHPSAWHIQTPLRAGVFTPSADLETGAFYAFDHPQMTQYLALGASTLASQFWVSSYTDEPPLHLKQTPAERHIGYAMTWFGLALSVLGVYLTFHIRTNRLNWKKRVKK